MKYRFFMPGPKLYSRKSFRGTGQLDEYWFVTSMTNIGDAISWRNILISNNVGGVKRFSGTLLHPLVKERHFALVDDLPPTWARFESLGSGTRSDPAISSNTYGDQDSFIRTPWLWERDTQSLRR